MTNKVTIIPHQKITSFLYLQVCLDLHDVKIELNETEISICTPFRPMLGQRVVLEEVEKLMQHRDFIIEMKIDGERIQLHKNDQEYRFVCLTCSNKYTQFKYTKVLCAFKL